MDLRIERGAHQRASPPGPQTLSYATTNYKSYKLIVLINFLLIADFFAVAAFLSMATPTCGDTFQPRCLAAALTSTTVLFAIADGQLQQFWRCHWIFCQRWCIVPVVINVPPIVTRLECNAF